MAFVCLISFFLVAVAVVVVVVVVCVCVCVCALVCCATLVVRVQGFSPIHLCVQYSKHPRVARLLYERGGTHGIIHAILLA